MGKSKQTGKKVRRTAGGEKGTQNITPAPRLRLKRRLTLAQFKQLCEQLHQTYPGWREYVGPQTRAWVQVAYNGTTVLINPRRGYVLEADVVTTAQQLIDELTEQSTEPWGMAGYVWRRAVRRGSAVLGV